MLQVKHGSRFPSRPAETDLAPARPFLPGTPLAADRVAVVVAHPDDETIGCGGQLGEGVAYVVVVTDGAPRDLKDAKALGFGSAADYANARRQELEAAIDVADMRPDRLCRLGVPDQQASRQLTRITCLLARRLAEHPVDAAVTHAFEGGHPDHDATAFAMHSAIALLARAGRTIPIIEMPFYRADGDGVAYQRFAADGGAEEVIVTLSAEPQALKRRMIAAHRTQRGVLQLFSTREERFRSAPSYDFTRLPNGGELLYERHPWGLSGKEWLQLAAAALQELGLRGAAC